MVFVCVHSSGLVFSCYTFSRQKLFQTEQTEQQKRVISISLSQKSGSSEVRGFSVWAESRSLQARCQQGCGTLGTRLSPSSLKFLADFLSLENWRPTTLFWVWVTPSFWDCPHSLAHSLPTSITRVFSSSASELSDGFLPPFSESSAFLFCF